MAITLNHKSVLASVLVAGALLGGLATSTDTFAEVTNATDPVQVDNKTDEGTKIENPTADQTGNPKATGEADVTVEAGSRTLDQVVKKLDFGTVSMESLLSKDTTVTATVPKDSFQVTDYSGSKNGWQLNMTVDSLEIKAGDQLQGTLKLNDATMQIGSQTAGTGPIFTGDQPGLWSQPQDVQAALTVPKVSSATKGAYSAKLTYTLSEGVGNTGASSSKVQ